MGDKPWWYPQKINADYFQQIRDDYYDKTDWSDEEISGWLGLGDTQKYVTTWDHIGDAYSEYEPLADAFFELKTQLESERAKLDAVRTVADNRSMLDDYEAQYIYSALGDFSKPPQQGNDDE